MSVVWRVLKARHIPVGMENFTATDDRGWRTIQRVLDDTDYYVLILAGKYGSVDPRTSISWTQREYEYAVEKAIPVIAFVRERHCITADKQEDAAELRTKLDAFIATVRDRHLCVPWEAAEDLGGAVVDALRNHIDDDEGTPAERLGWFRGDQVVTPTLANELARLSDANAGLERAKIHQETLAKLRTERFVADVERFQRAYMDYSQNHKRVFRANSDDQTEWLQLLVSFYEDHTRILILKYWDLLGNDLLSQAQHLDSLATEERLNDRSVEDRGAFLASVANELQSVATTLHERTLAR